MPFTQVFLGWLSFDCALSRKRHFVFASLHRHVILSFCHHAIELSRQWMFSLYYARKLAHSFTNVIDSHLLELCLRWMPFLPSAIATFPPFPLFYLFVSFFVSLFYIFVFSYVSFSTFRPCFVLPSFSPLSLVYMFLSPPLPHLSLFIHLNDPFNSSLCPPPSNFKNHHSSNLPWLLLLQLFSIWISRLHETIRSLWNIISYWNT